MSSAMKCAVTVVAQLVAQGMTELVLAPGSRSAPLALAAWRAERAGLIRLHVRVDERSAAFLALGLAKAGGRPVAVITTSGTAVGNLLPAVMEAHHSGVPLLVVSADRPAALVGFGANQTTEQAGLFAGFVRYSARVSDGAPPPSWAAQAARGWTSAAGLGSRDPGPVHLNIELSDPLVADDEPDWPTLPPVRQAAPVAGRAEPLAGGPHTLVVCGDATPALGRRVAELSAAAALPLVAEPSSNARRGSSALQCGRLLVDGPIGERIERVVVFGRPTLSRPLNRLLSRSDVELIVVSETATWVDPGWRASSLATAVDIEAGPPRWRDEWLDADRQLARALRRRLADQSAISGPELAQAVSAGASGALVIGNSNPIRDADLAPIRDDGPEVYANRGLAGIDGTIATASGIALASGSPTTLLCGDLTFLHDAAALAVPAVEPRPDLRIVVADDHGGSIFATLEYGQERFADPFERVFATPVDVDLVALAQAHRVSARRISTRAELATALASSPQGTEVLVVDIDRAGRRSLLADLNP